MKVTSLIISFCFSIYIGRVFLQRQCSGTDQRSGQGQGNEQCNSSTKASPDDEKRTRESGVQFFLTSESTKSEIGDNSVTDDGNQNGMAKSGTNFNVNPRLQSSSTNNEKSNTKNRSSFRGLLSTLPSCKPKTLPDKLGSMLNEVVDTTPDCNPMTTPEQVAAKVMNSLGESWVIAAVVIAFVILLFYREKTYESYLHMWQLLFMFIVHLLTLLFAMRTDLYITCHVVSFILQYGYICHFSLLLLEIGQAHALKTNIISSGKFTGHDDTHLFFLVFPVLPTIATACFTWDKMTSIYSCWLNYDNDVALGTTLILIVGFSALIFVMIEDANIRFYGPLPSTDKNQRFIARINIGTLWLRTILHFSSWLSTSFAIYVQRFALFPTAFAINVSLGVVIFVSHVGGNMKSWNAVAQAKRMIQRRSVTSVQIFEL